MHRGGLIKSDLMFTLEKHTLCTLQQDLFQTCYLDTGRCIIKKLNLYIILLCTHLYQIKMSENIVLLATPGWLTPKCRSIPTGNTQFLTFRWFFSTKMAEKGKKVFFLALGCSAPKSWSIYTSVRAQRNNHRLVLTKSQFYTLANMCSL